MQTQTYYREEQNNAELARLRELEQKRNEGIIHLWMRCDPLAAIAKASGVTEDFVGNVVQAHIERMADSEQAQFQDNFTPPIYNVWTFGEKSNRQDHPGNSEQRIVENLLYLHTKPFDVVVDPFAGGGSTLDVCQRRLRRCWVSDLTPIPDRASEIRQMDIRSDLPDVDWDKVALTYLDPPYWIQVQGEYSQKPEDLANMPLDEFHTPLVGVVHRIADVQQKGVIALIIQPTQWRSEGRRVVDHITYLCTNVNHPRLSLRQRIAAPYHSEQFTPQQVQWAKQERDLLVLTREIVVWEVAV